MLGKRNRSRRSKVLSKPEQAYFRCLRVLRYFGIISERYYDRLYKKIYNKKHEAYNAKKERREYLLVKNKIKRLEREGTKTGEPNTELITKLKERRLGLYKKMYYVENRDRIVGKQKIYDAENREHISEKKKAYYREKGENRAERKEENKMQGFKEYTGEERRMAQRMIDSVKEEVKELLNKIST